MGPEFENGDGRLRPIAANNASPAQSGAPGGTLNRSTPRRLRRSYSTLAGAGSYLLLAGGNCMLSRVDVHPARASCGSLASGRLACLASC